MAENQNVPIEAREIRGLTFRNLIAIIVCTATVIGTVYSMRMDLEKEIHEIKIREQDDEKFEDLKFSQLETRIIQLENEVRRLSDRDRSR